jgi:CubicO group peptidase (beta-lactamase class C family)
MDRRTFLLGALSAPVLSAMKRDKFEPAAAVLAKSVADGQVRAASLCVRHGKDEYVRAFGEAKTPDAMFLLASITKTLTAAAVLTLVDKDKLRLDDPVVKYLPEFSAEAQSKVTVLQLLTHTSGLPDQLPENAALRRAHSTLADFTAAALRTPLLFEPGKRFSYSSMGILLASEIARRISATDIRELVDLAVFQPLEMKRSAMGLGRFKREDVILNQVEHAAPEAGAGDPTAKEWDWNSSWWRSLGAPWGAAHASAPDVARFFAEYLHPTERMMKPDTALRMVKNHNAEGITPRGLGFAVGSKSASPGCSEKTFSHSGSSGTFAWADPATDTVCVVLTTLPGSAASPHPLRIAADLVAKAVS